MAKPTAEQTRKAHQMALRAVACVALFACAFIGLVMGLDQMASVSVSESVFVEEDSSEDGPFYVLLIGSDSRKGTALYTGRKNEHSQVDQRADIITLMRVDPDTYTITLISVPRDTVVPGETDKINSHLVDNDPLEVVDAVERLTGAKIDYYMMTTFTAFENLIDALGGIRVNVPVSVTVNDPRTADYITVEAGKNKKLNGPQALVLARARKDYETDQDALRQVNVRAIEQAMIEAVIHPSEGLNVERVVSILENETTTNMDLLSFAPMMLDFVEHADEVTFYSCTGPYDGGIRPSDEQWVVDASRQTWAAIMSAADAGRDPSDIIVAPSFK